LAVASPRVRRIAAAQQDSFHVCVAAQSATIEYSSVDALIADMWAYFVPHAG
jgi:hypothetical protein